MREADTLQRLMDEWVPIQGGAGAVNIQVAFKPAQVGLLLLLATFVD
jgi:hypothetical protein